MKKFRFILLLILFLFPQLGKTASLPPWSGEVTRLVEKGAVYVENEKGEVLFDYEGDLSLVPASTFKLVTGLISLQQLGVDFRFKTDFFLDANHNLYVKGYGDPYIVSEELQQIAAQLKTKGLKSVKGIFLDATYFADIKIPGVSASLNPYDALNSALSANFNTINIIKKKEGEIVSAEPQTPITEITRALANRAPIGKSRVNLAAHPAESILYVGHLLKAFLVQEGVSVEGEIVAAPVSQSAKLVYSHVSSKKLSEVVQAMMKYSTNFIANQLFLTVGVQKFGAPATLEKGKKVFEAYLKQQLGFSSASVEEGSGISRGNHLSAHQLVQVLKAFEKYRSLLPEKLDKIEAKTGTLRGVSSLAGYFTNASGKTIYFAIILNQESNYREQIAKILYQHFY